jgi:peptidoglycan hydrolase-like protein with peptidoglycan-binding domain
MNQPNEVFPDIGYLNVEVRTVRNAQPISDAKVTVSKLDATLDELNTDAAGQTVTIELGTPPFDYSQEPEGNKPYSEYNLRIDAQGFRSVIVQGVQLLPENTAIQRIRLSPLAEGVPAEPQVIVVEANQLWGNFPPKIPEPEVKPLPTGGGYIVLAEPVIPEFMVVHLGAPEDTSAENVWVPFRDYITNVACSEIYSTWPSETIRANVLAILSFALNRVYTEWYRSRGFNFTITNSTAFDQAFSYGRNIFGNVLNVVNEIFTTYITKPGIRQPLFTQFCDGTRVSCNGLSQWGSQQMGTQGSDALTILRNYYGNNIYLTQAQKVQGVPMSYPGQPLQVGSSGLNVRMIQTQLNSISDNYPMIPKVRVDGIYGPQTAQAVRTFQQIFYLPVTGVVDFATWYEISKIYVAVNRLSELG